MVIEKYADEGAAFAHNRNCAVLLKRCTAIAKLTSIQVHGALGSDLSKWVDEYPEAYAFPPLFD